MRQDVHGKTRSTTLAIWNPINRFFSHQRLQYFIALALVCPLVGCSAPETKSGAKASKVSIAIKDIPNGKPLQDSDWNVVEDSTQIPANLPAEAKDGILGDAFALREIKAGEYIWSNEPGVTTARDTRLIAVARREIPAGKRIQEGDVECKLFQNSELPKYPDEPPHLSYIEFPATTLLQGPEPYAALSTKWHVLGRFARSAIPANSLILQEQVAYHPNQALIARAARNIAQNQVIGETDVNYYVKQEKKGEPFYFEIVGTKAARNYAPGDIIPLKSVNLEDGE